MYIHYSNPFHDTNYSCQIQSLEKEFPSLKAVIFSHIIKILNLLLTAELGSHFLDPPSHFLKLQVVSLCSLLLQLYHHFVKSVTYYPGTMKMIWYQVKLSLCLTKYHAMKKFGKVEIQLYTFLTMALEGDEWSASCPSHFTPGKKNYKLTLNKI